MRQNATASEIKRAYRIKAKQLHPDATHSHDSEKFRLLVKAYKTLSDKKQRSLFDEVFYTYSHSQRTEKGSFDYRKWLAARTDYESRAKLIFFDLMHNREDEAVQEFKRMNMNHADFSLKRWFSREDFMDYGYILAEELVLRDEYYDAILLLEQIIRLEKSCGYFRLFFPEVMDFTLNILRRKVAGFLSDELCIDVFERALDMGFSKSDDAFFLRKMAEAYQRLGDTRTAEICMRASCGMGA